MNNDKVSVYLSQGGFRMSVQMPKAEADKMGEIRKRDPEGTWEERDMELHRQAQKELEEESSASQQPSKEQAFMKMAMLLKAMQETEE